MQPDNNQKDHPESATSNPTPAVRPDTAASGAVRESRTLRALVREFISLSFYACANLGRSGKLNVNQVTPPKASACLPSKRGRVRLRAVANEDCPSTPKVDPKKLRRMRF